MDSRTNHLLFFTAIFPTGVDSVIETLTETTGGRAPVACLDAFGAERSWAEPQEAARWRPDADGRML